MSLCPPFRESDNSAVAEPRWTNATNVEHMGEREPGRARSGSATATATSSSDSESTKPISGAISRCRSWPPPHCRSPRSCSTWTSPGAETADGLFYCISTRALGEPLEMCSNDEWRTVVERVADALEAMHALTPAAVDTAVASVSPWREQLLSIERDDLDPRGRDGLRSSQRRSEDRPPSSSASHTSASSMSARLHSRWFTEISSTATSTSTTERSPASSTGAANAGATISSTWHGSTSGPRGFPNLDIGVLREALRERWSTTDYAPDREPERTPGVSHLHRPRASDLQRHNRWLEADLDDVVDRMTALSLI